jgi:hypothetical protein
MALTTRTTSDATSLSRCAHRVTTVTRTVLIDLVDDDNLEIGCNV